MERPGRPARRGRGALDNPSPRFEQQRYVESDDGWNTIEEQPPELSTIVQP